MKHTQRITVDITYTKTQDYITSPANWDLPAIFKRGTKDAEGGHVLSVKLVDADPVSIAFEVGDVALGKDVKHLAPGCLIQNVVSSKVFMTTISRGSFLVGNDGGQGAVIQDAKYRILYIHN